MLKLLLVAGATLGIASTATAADLPRREPPPPPTYVGKTPIPIIGKLPVIGKLPGKTPAPPPAVVTKG